jgi:hypothetical protein
MPPKQQRRPRRSARRSIVLTFDDAGTDFEFGKRLADLKAAHPSWTVQGIDHSADAAAPLIPVKPAGAPPGDGAARSPTDGAVLSYLDAVRASGGGDDDSDAASASTESSLGNVPGEEPVTVAVGMRFRVAEEPYFGQHGAVVQVRGRDSFQLLLDGTATTWWCGRSDVTAVAMHRGADGGDGSATAPRDYAALLAENHRLRMLLRQHDVPDC